MAKIKIKQIRSAINRPLRQKRTLQALGFRKLNQTLEVEDNPQMRGMIHKVQHMLEIVK